MSIGSIVNTATVELASSPSEFPFAARLAFRTLHSVHRFWRWIRLGNIYRDPNNFAQLAAGHGLNYMIGNSALIRISAISVLIASRIAHAVSQYKKLQDSWLKMKDAFHHRYPTPVRSSWDQKQGIFSLSTIVWIKTTSKTHVYRVQLLAICIFKVGKNALLLSLRIIDAMETFTLKPEVREEGINLLFVNTATCMSQLVENKDFLLESLDSNRAIIETILTGLGSQLNADCLIDTVESALDKTHSLHRSVSTVNDHVGEFVSACGKKWTYEFLREIGLRHLVPASMMPSSTPPWEHPQRRKIKKRFPPKGLLKKPTLETVKTNSKGKNSTHKSLGNFLGKLFAG